MFSIASVVFIGGSLVPRGGQNILEPASWAKPVLFGPSMEDFRDARDILVRCGAGIEVRNARTWLIAQRNYCRTRKMPSPAGVEVVKKY